MASINSIMGGGSTGSVYGNRNILSGLASGMDTESMIENAISGYKMKISLLQQQRTVVEWQQSAYRNIIDKMVSFNQKYTSYSKGNNLMSQGFFDSAVKVVAQGANADKISASGKTSSDIQINGVAKLATDSRYTIGTGNLAPSYQASGSFDIKQTAETGAVKGDLKLGFGGKTITVSFDDKDVFKGKTAADKAAEIAKAINSKLEDQKITFDDGSQVQASKRIQAVADDQGNVKFETMESTNAVWIDSTTGNVGDLFGISIDKTGKTDAELRELKSFKIDNSNQDKLTNTSSMVDLLNDKGFEIALDGVSKTIKGPTLEELKAVKNTDGQAVGDSWTAADYENLLQKKVDDAFGTVTVEVEENGVKKEVQKPKLEINLDAVADGKVQFSAKAHSADSKFSVSSAAGKEIGMETALTSYVNMNQKLGALIPNGFSKDQYIQADVKEADLKAEENGVFTDKDGNHFIKDPDTKEGEPAVFYKADKEGNALVDFKINGKSVGTFTKESTLKDVMTAVNTNENSDVKMAYSEFTNRFTFASKVGGADGKIEFDGGLSKAMFGENKDAGVKADYEKGKNARLFVSVNGEKRTIERSSNTIEIDGMKITLKGTFDKGQEGVSFKTESDSDKIVSVVKDMVKDYNEMAKAIKDAYSTMPQQNSKGKPYMPLTDKDRKDMSESEVKNYEEKAKQGILFADRDLANAYDGLRNALNVLGVRGSGAGDIGLTTSFSGGATTLELDEEKLRKALEQDPEKVKDIFTRSKDNGASSDGLMNGLKRQLDKYANTTGAVKGLFIEKAGTPQAPVSIFHNEMQKKLGNFDKQITGWQTKLADKIDYYNHKFTILEQMIAEMNNQGGMLMGMGGGF